MMELKEAGIPRKLAPTVGIPIDPRRKNYSTESLAVNVERLKEYRKRLILFPRKSGQHKSLDAKKEELSAAKDGVKILSTVLPIDSGIGLKHGFSEIKTSDLPSGVEGGAYKKLREARSEARLVGVREKRAKAKAEESEAKKK